MVLVFNDYPRFKPDLTPYQMFNAGIIGGSYFRNITSPKTNITYTTEDHKQFKFLSKIPKHKLITNDYDKNINKFKVKAGSSYNDWMDKNWIDETTAPRGWIQWYCNFYNGRRTIDDKRQIKRWKNFASKSSGRFRIRYQNLITKEKSNKIDFHPVLQQNLLEWAVDSRKMKP
jgi:hypothetical protein